MFHTDCDMNVDELVTTYGPPPEHGYLYLNNLYAWCEAIEARVVLEIGFGWGWSTLAFMASVGKRRGRVITLDPQPRVLPEECEARGCSMGATMEFHQVMSHDYNLVGEIDVLYVDGGITQVVNDVNRFYPNIRAGGLVILDGWGQVIVMDGIRAFLAKYHTGIPMRYTDQYAHMIHVKESSCTA